MTTKEIGDIGEKAAQKLLKKSGYKILSRNLHISHNELDIIAQNKEYIAFVEVKTRTCSPDDQKYGVPSSSVTRNKRSHLISAANDYLRKNKTNKQPRMDVVEVWIDKDSKKVIKMNHIENAYEAY